MTQVAEKQPEREDENKKESTSEELKGKSSTLLDSKDMPSAKLMLSVAQKEYEYEVDRKKTLETRAGIFVAFVGVMFAFIARNADIVIFNNINQTQFMLYALIFGLFFLIPVLLLLASLYCFIHVIVTKKYLRVDLKNFNENRAQLKEEISALKIMNAYVKVVALNTEQNDIKSKYFSIGVITTGIASALIVLMYLISFIL
ncbi:hypothetical protein [Paenibacillus glucanolyticus]|uniref:hypothetical protein n=1 Tax=Paenibacillus glucanolyticus TaxID=59843 RepID=UPI0034CEC441